MAMALQRHKTDMLIIGAGGAGLFAALHARQAAPAASIALAVKGLLGKCGCTRMVQGGYNAALGAGDSVARHFMDTIRGGKWLPHQEMAWKLCETAVIRVQQLENELGCFFDRNPDGSLHSKAFAGQSVDRTVHKGDLTGIEIINRLMEQVRALSGVALMEEYRVLALLPNTAGDALAGALLVDMRSGALHVVQSKAVLLATGGGPSMYRYHTPSGDKSMDGLAMSLRLGLELRDMEMVQFHPTGLLAGSQTRMTGTVLEEGLRGAGGHLLNGDGARFMFDYDAAGERATRDVVSRGMYAQIRDGRTSANGGVYLSMAHLDADLVRQKFKGMVKRCHDCGFDLVAGRVEVMPTAHYLMGGLVCDPATRTPLPGLYVAGEDAGGVHGANRLGGNGVANSTVFGGIAGETMAADLRAERHWQAPDEARLADELQAAGQPFTQPPGDLYALRERLLDCMWQDVGVSRDAAGLQRGLAQIAQLKQELMHTGLGQADRRFNLGWHDWLNLRNLLDVSAVIAQAALARADSCGAHHRQDCTVDADPAAAYFTLLKRQPDGELDVSRRSVQFTLVQPGQSLDDG